MIATYELSRHWRIFAIRGVSALVFSNITLIWPTISLQVHKLLFGVYALFDDVVAIATALGGETEHQLSLDAVWHRARARVTRRCARLRSGDRCVVRGTL